MADPGPVPKPEEKNGNGKFAKLSSSFGRHSKRNTSSMGGGNAKKLKKLPPSTILGDNQNAFVGGFRMWSEDGTSKN